MKKKLWLIPVVIMVIVAALWLGGIVPEQIGKIFGIKEQYSKIQLEGVENADNRIDIRTNDVNEFIKANV